MNIDPAYPTTLQIAIANERDNVGMRNNACLVNALIGVQKLSTARSVADKKFSIHEVVPFNRFSSQKPVQLLPVRGSISERPNPYGSVNQDHQATLRLTEGFSRRLGTSSA